MPIITEVVIKKQGQGKSGPWICYGITLDDGRKASGFELVRVGDSVAVQPNAKNPGFLDYRLMEGHPASHKATQDEAVNAPGSPVQGFNGAGLDQRQRAIIRQHSQSMAIEVLKLKVTLNELTAEDITPVKLTKLSDYFDADVLEAASCSAKGYAG